jgi:hypothetical protein
VKPFLGISEGLLGVVFLLVAINPSVLSFFGTVRSCQARPKAAAPLGVRILFALLGTLVLVDSLRGLAN